MTDAATFGAKRKRRLAGMNRRPINPASLAQITQPTGLFGFRLRNAHHSSHTKNPHADVFDLEAGLRQTIRSENGPKQHKPSSFLENVSIRAKNTHKMSINSKDAGDQEDHGMVVDLDELINEGVSDASFRQTGVTFQRGSCVDDLII